MQKILDSEEGISEITQPSTNMMIGEALSVPSSHMSQQNHRTKVMIKNEHDTRKSPAKQCEYLVLSYDKISPK